MKKTQIFPLFAVAIFAATMFAAGGLPPGVYKCGTYPSKKAPYVLGQVLGYNVGSHPYNPTQGYTGIPAQASCGVYNATSANLAAPAYVSGNVSYVGGYTPGETCPGPVQTFLWQGSYDQFSTGPTDSDDPTWLGQSNGTTMAAQATCDVVVSVWVSCDDPASGCYDYAGKGDCTTATLSAQQQAFNTYGWNYPLGLNGTDECGTNNFCELSLGVDITTGGKITADLNCTRIQAPFRTDDPYDPPPTYGYEAHMSVQVNPATGLITTTHEKVGSNPDFGWFYHVNPDGSRTQTDCNDW
jgi:hypothetical protein